MRWLSRWLLGVLLSWSSSAWAVQPWVVQASQDHTFPQWTIGGRTVVSTGLAFWGAEWLWAGIRSEPPVAHGDGRYDVSGYVPGLVTQWRAKVHRKGERSLKYDIELHGSRLIQGVVGGGLVFRFDLTRFGDAMGKPELLEDGRGWRWGRVADQRLEVRFDPPLPKVYFEGGAGNEIRAFFLDGIVQPGRVRHIMRVTWGDGVQWQSTMLERLGGGDPNSWPLDMVAPGNVPVDLRAALGQCKVAGLRGKVKARGDQLVFEDGTPAVFWGTNVTAYALFATPRDMVRQQARRLAALGYNLVRLHHHDSHWVKLNVFDKRGSQDDTHRLSESALESIDWWVKALKDEGIYVWLDVHVQRQLRAGDGIYGFQELSKGSSAAELKGYNYVNITIQQAMRRFQQAYLDRKNAFTGVAYKDEPAVLGLLITNENDITHHYGNALLPDKNVPKHNKLYMALADGFARQQDLSRRDVWRSWQHGDSKLFLNDLEQRFNVEMMGDLRRLGFDNLLATTSTWGRNPLSSLPALTAGDVVDVHSYGGQEQLSHDPAWSANLVHWIAAAQVLGKPLTVTEWNAEPFPLPDRHVLPLYVAAVASHQGWDALMHYAYSQESFQGRGGASNWHSWNDPSLLPMLGAAAILYRQHHVQPATNTYVFDPGANLLFGRSISPDNSPALRMAMERSRLVIAMPKTHALPWLKREPIPANALVLRNPDAVLLPRGAGSAVSDTGELMRDWRRGVYVINTAKTQAVLGWLGGRRVKFKDVEMLISTRSASIAVQSLDGQPVGQSKDILLSVGTRSQPQDGLRMPFRVEPLLGTVSIQAPAGLKAYRNGPLNQWVELDAKELTRIDGRYVINFNGRKSVQWVSLRRPS